MWKYLLCTYTLNEINLLTGCILHVYIYITCRGTHTLESSTRISISKKKSEKLFTCSLSLRYVLNPVSQFEFFHISPHFVVVIFMYRDYTYMYICFVYFQSQLLVKPNEKLRTDISTHMFQLKYPYIHVFLFYHWSPCTMYI